MDEADTLCSRIAIMVQGKVQCIGHKAELKKRYGEGFYVNLTLENEPSPAEVASILSFFSRILKINTQDKAAQLRVSYKFSKSIRVLVPKEAGDAISLLLRIYRVMDAHAERVRVQLGIKDWGLAQTSLTEV